METQVLNRKTWIKNLGSYIAKKREGGLSESAIKKHIKEEFKKRSTWGENIAFLVASFLLFALIGFGIHFSSVMLMWEADIHAVNLGFSPTYSLVLMLLCGVLIFGLVLVYAKFFLDWFKYHKTLDESLDESFYLRLFRVIALLGLIAFAILMIVVILASMQIASEYGVDFSNVFIRAIGELFD
ncbi:hypothetical protein [Helicobacter burdigaliensis]|uniref:hypothetical protein n=1 Tax=Helicobacter burdigaliensis TaxID=2315334 RepID=UPI000EF75326|nr:hypothetical protein [Helicobacter burdigaliensis]